VTALTESLSAEILASGPLLFSRFMEAALYDSQQGYYRRERDPFGKQGDFFTASQLQPVFGRLIAAAVGDCRRQLGDPADFRVVEWGAGRGEMQPYLEEFGHIAIDVGRGASPGRFTGVVFANELFDALPVDVVRVSGGGINLMRVGWNGGAFTWEIAEPLQSPWREYVERLAAHFDDRSELLIELPVRLEQTLAGMAEPLERGFVIAIDYGYTAREIVRFPRGTLMSYRRHQAIDDVLVDPGIQDITAHVPFTHLAGCASRLKLRENRFESLASFLLRTGESDQFADALKANDDRAAAQLRLQLKTLLFGMGETFRCVTLEKEGAPKS